MQVTKDYLHIGNVVWSEVSFNNSGMNREVHVPLCERLAGRFRRSTRLFANSIDGAHAAANIFSLIETCKTHNVNPYDWLRATLSKIPACQTLEQYEALLPFNFAQHTTDR